MSRTWPRLSDSAPESSGSDTSPGRQATGCSVSTSSRKRRPPSSKTARPSSPINSAFSGILDPGTAALLQQILHSRHIGPLGLRFARRLPADFLDRVGIERAVDIHLDKPILRAIPIAVQEEIREALLTVAAVNGVSVLRYRQHVPVRPRAAISLRNRYPGQKPVAIHEVEGVFFEQGR